MLGGIVTFGFGVLISDAGDRYGISAIVLAVVKELHRRGETKETIIDKVERMPLSLSLKAAITQILDELEPVSGEELTLDDTPSTSRA